MAVTRTVEFAAAHRLHSPALSDDANRALYGKCNNPNGHGHTYRLEATVTGPLDDSGLVGAAARLDRALAEVVLRRFDGANLARDVPEMAGTTGTSEELARLLRRLLAEAVGEALARVVLHETPNNVFEAAGPSIPDPWSERERAGGGRATGGAGAGRQPRGAEPRLRRGGADGARPPLKE